MESNKCNQCDYASFYASVLRTHLKTHSGEKSNKCNQCDYASFYGSALRTHLKTHSGEKSNKCNQCDFASSYESSLSRHLKTHIGEKSNNWTIVVIHALIQPHWYSIWQGTLKKDLKMNQCASSHADALRKYMQNLKIKLTQFKRRSPT